MFSCHHVSFFLLFFSFFLALFLLLSMRCTVDVMDVMDVMYCDSLFAFTLRISWSTSALDFDLI